MSLDDNHQPQQNPEGSPDPPPDTLPAAGPSAAMETPPAASDSGRPCWPTPRGTNDPSLPEDLRVPWSWLDLLLLVIVAIAGTVVLSMLVVVGFALLGVSFRQLQNSIHYKSLLLIINQALLSVLLLVYLSAQMRLRFGAPFWRTA